MNLIVALRRSTENERAEIGRPAKAPRFVVAADAIRATARRPVDWCWTVADATEAIANLTDVDIRADRPSTPATCNCWPDSEKVCSIGAWQSASGHSNRRRPHLAHSAGVICRDWCCRPTAKDRSAKKREIEDANLIYCCWYAVKFVAPCNEDTSCRKTSESKPFPLQKGAK